MLRGLVIEKKSIFGSFDKTYIEILMIVKLAVWG